MKCQVTCNQVTLPHTLETNEISILCLLSLQKENLQKEKSSLSSCAGPCSGDGPRHPGPSVRDGQAGVLRQDQRGGHQQGGVGVGVLHGHRVVKYVMHSFKQYNPSTFVHY